MADLDLVTCETAHSPAMGERIAFGSYLFDTTSATLLRGDELVPLGGRAAAVLQVLLEANGEVVGKPQLIDRVSPASQAVLVLHYYNQLSLDEVAAVLGIPLGTAKSRLSYGLSVLRHMV